MLKTLRMDLNSPFFYLGFSYSLFSVHKIDRCDRRVLDRKRMEYKYTDFDEQALAVFMDINDFRNTYEAIRMLNTLPVLRHMRERITAPTHGGGSRPERTERLGVYPIETLDDF